MWDTVTRAKQEREKSGPWEVEVSYGQEADLHKHLKACDKNPGHQKFIPVDQFNVDHLPPGCRDMDLVDMVRALSDLTVRVSVKCVSNRRPETVRLCGQDKPFPCYMNRGDNMIRIGTAWVEKVKKYSYNHSCDEFSRKIFQNSPEPKICQEYVNSPTPKICQSQEYVNSSKPKVCQCQEYVNSHTPKTCQCQECVNSHTPKTCQCQECVNSHTPKTCQCQEYVNSHTPKTCQCQECVNFSKPKACQCQEYVNSHTPKTCQCQEYVNSHTPKTCQCQECVNSSKPKVCQCQEYVNSHTPKTCQCQEYVNSHTPKTCQCQEYVKSHTPKTCQCQECVNSSKPKVCQCQEYVNSHTPKTCQCQEYVNSHTPKTCQCQEYVNSHTPKTCQCQECVNFHTSKICQCQEYVNSPTSKICQYQKNMNSSQPKVCQCQECVNSPTPKTQFAQIHIITAAHVVYDSLEAADATCHLFFDKGGTPNACSGVVTLTGFSVVCSQDVCDFCEMRYITHDLDLADRLDKMVARLASLWKSVCDKYSCRQNETYQLYPAKELPDAMDKLTIIVSHPHGCSKQVSIGYCKHIVGNDGFLMPYTYTTATCPGSSGAHVIVLESRRWYYLRNNLVHCGTYEENKELNFCLNVFSIPRTFPLFICSTNQ